MERQKASKIIGEHLKNNPNYSFDEHPMFIKGIDFGGISFKDCELDFPYTFYNCDFSDCNFDNCVVSDSFTCGQCDFSRASFKNVHLSHVNFVDCKFDQTDFSTSWFQCSPSQGWDLSTAKIDSIWKDLFEVLALASWEIPDLEDAIAKGKINGLIYEDPDGCGCLNGTLTKAAKKRLDVEAVDDLDIAKNERRPIEIFFWSIRPGDTPENNWKLKAVMEKIQEFKQK